jgi:polar amino acid transport system substrate-binding protein
MKYLWIILMSVFSLNISAETVTLCSLDRYGLSQKDGNGYYWDLLRAVYQTEGIKLKHYSAPFKRCLLELHAKKVDGAVAVFHTPERDKQFTYPKSRLSFSSYGLSYLKETSLDKIENVQGTVGIIRGYDFSSWLPGNIKLEALNNNTQAIGMLKLKRIEYIADDLQDVRLTLNKMGEKSEQFVFKTFYTKNLYVPFTRDVRGQRLADRFDAGLQKLFKSGQLQELAKKYHKKGQLLDSPLAVIVQQH